jgi:hypothetical protein
LRLSSGFQDRICTYIFIAFPLLSLKNLSEVIPQTQKQRLHLVMKLDAGFIPHKKSDIFPHQTDLRSRQAQLPAPVFAIGFRAVPQR